jgi:probable HAF family extracellular repeat protein
LAHEGQVVGYYLDGSSIWHSFLYSNGTFTPIDDPLAASNRHNGADGTIAQGINDAGQVVGYYTDANGVAHGFLYSNGNYVTVDASPSTVGLDEGTYLSGINDAGQIVGNYVNDNGGYGFLANPEPGNTLKLDDAPQFTGTVTGFGGGDSIDMTDINFATLAPLKYTPNAGNTGGTLTASDGTNTAKIALLGQYLAAGFSDAPDSGAGSVITYTPPPAQTSQTLLATPQHS